MFTVINLQYFAEDCFEITRLSQIHPEHADELINIILENPSEFKRLVKSFIHLDELQRTFPTYKDKLIKIILNNLSKFKRLVEDYTYLVMLRRDFPKYGDELITTVLNNPKEFDYIFEGDSGSIDCLKKEFPKYEREIDELNVLSVNALKELSKEENVSKRPEWVKNKLMKISDDHFMDEIIKNQAIAQLVVNSPELSNRLNNIQWHTNLKGASFKKSCTAFCIMLFLYKTKMISEVSRTKELEIYFQIWRAPKEDAKLSLVKDYLKKNNISVVFLEDFNITAQLKLNPKFLDVYNDEIVNSRNREIDKNPNHYFLIITYNLNLTFHTLLLFYEKGVYKLTDPENNVEIEDNDKDNILKRLSEFGGVLNDTGIALKIVKRSGLFSSKITVPDVLNTIDVGVSTKQHFSVQ